MIRSKLAVAAVVLLCATLMPLRADAQLEASLNAQRFQPAPSYHSFVTVDTARLLPKMGFGAGIMFDYAWRPVQISSSALERQEGMVDGLIGGRLSVGFAPVEWAEIDVIFPFMQLTQVGTLEDVAGNRFHYSIGDVELLGRFRLLAEEKGVGIAIIPFVSFPTGNRNLLATRGHFTFGAKAAVSRHWKVFHFGAYAGYRFVPGSAVYGNFAADDELVYGGGVGVSVLPNWLDVNLELMGSGIIGPERWNHSQDPHPGGVHSPLELHANARLMTPVGLDVVLGGGPGLAPAPGTPGFRVYLGVSWAPPINNEVVDPDPDGDRIKGDKDQCPDVPEDKDGFEDEDGCPEPDNDGDGVLDIDEPECRDKPEDMDGFEDEDGCPDLDNDGDGIPDDKDNCPLVAEDADGFEDTDGCPDIDNDADGILDVDDVCPDQPENINGEKDEDGCPDEIQVVVREDQKKIVILDRVLFETDSDVLKGESTSILTAIAKTLVDYPGIKLVRVDGHTDDAGSPEHNQDLSERRAKRVLDWLVTKGGVAKERLQSKGFGEDVPLVANDSDANMSKNRRVEFTILDQDLGDNVEVKE